MLNSGIDEQDHNFPTFKVIMMGFTGTGKTKLITRYIYHNYEHSGVSTLAVDCSLVKRAKAKYSYYDTAGQQIYRATVNMYVRGADAILLIYSTDSVKSFQQLDYYYKKAQEFCPNSLVYIVGCKCDLPSYVPIQMVKQKYPSLKHFLTSSMNNYNVDQTFQQIQLDLLKKGKVSQKGIKIRQIKPAEKGQKKKCCS